MRIQDTIIQLLLRQPFYGYLATSITVLENNNIPDIRMIYFPEPALHYNKIWYESLKNNQAFGVLLHELLHLTLLHPLRRCGRDTILWIAACDMAVNEYIEEYMLNEKALTVRKLSLGLREDIPHFKSAEVYYDILNKLEGRLSLFGNENQISIRISGCEEMISNMLNNIQEEVGDINKKALESMMYQIIDELKEEDDIPKKLLDTIEEVYEKNTVDWRNIFKRFLIGRGRMDSRKSYKKESRRYEGFPGNKRSIGLRCLLAIDESGSIPDSQVREFYNELMEINCITAAKIYVTEFDISCSKPVLIENYVKSQKRLKNGGTDFRPVFKLADEMRIEFLIVFTDGDGMAPECSNQKVLWVLTRNGKKPAEYGFDVKLQEKI